MKPDISSMQMSLPSSIHWPSIRFCLCQPITPGLWLLACATYQGVWSAVLLMVDPEFSDDELFPYSMVWEDEEDDLDFEESFLEEEEDEDDLFEDDEEDEEDEDDLYYDDLDDDLDDYDELDLDDDL